MKDRLLNEIIAVHRKVERARRAADKAQHSRDLLIRDAYQRNGVRTIDLAEAIGVTRQAITKILGMR